MGEETAHPPDDGGNAERERITRRAWANQILWGKWTVPPDRRTGRAEQAQTWGDLRIENGRCEASSLPSS